MKIKIDWVSILKFLESLIDIAVFILIVYLIAFVAAVGNYLMSGLV